jgi:superfamily I DNA and/or RNA helicase
VSLGAALRGAALQTGGFDLEEAKLIAEGLCDSYLFIQGPPGSGKTYTGAHLILHLIRQGHRVGVAANSHAAIHNLLAEVERYASPEEGWSGLKKYSDDGNRYESEKGMIESSKDMADVTGGNHNLVAGTAWLFCREEMDGKLDYLFIDETRRMHPDVCRFVSQAMYEGRLESVAGCAEQRIDAPGELTGTGVRYVPVAHAGNTRASIEEAERIAGLIEDLLRGRYRRTDGTESRIEPQDIMVVAPYNAQVQCLCEQVPDGVRVGTVDKFQGQEAAVCFFSMATSSGEEIPRHVEFLFSRNRLNVAVSRARCLAVLVCSPELLHVRCRDAEQMRLVNALCWFAEMAGEA